MTLAPTEACESTLRLMSLNLRFGLAQDGPNGWDFRRKAYPGLLNTYPCDFYAFQEANDFQIDFLASLLHGYDYIGRRAQAPERWQNNVIFFHRKWRCTRHDHFYLSDTPRVESKFSDSRWPRQATLGTFECNNRSITCMVTHFDFVDHVQRLSANLIMGLLQGLAGSDPVLLTGDFNCAPDSACYAIFTDRDQAKGRRFKNAFDPAPDTGTFHGFSGTSEQPPIDWILYRGNLTVRSAQVITDRFNAYYPSDHFPLLAEFTWLKTR